MKRDERGVMVVEMAIYFPLIILAWFCFIVMSLYITQRIVLDKAVAQVCLDAADYLSDDLKKIGETNAFSGNAEGISVNPYKNIINGVANPYYPMNKSGFETKVKQRVVNLAKWSMIGGRPGVDAFNEGNVSVVYHNYFVAGELEITATQTVNLPIYFWLADDPLKKLTFTSTAKAMVFNTDSLVNDIDFVFEAVGRATGGVVDISKLKNFVSDLPGKLPSGD